tara:strand:- start:200 stop:337 length:138 start_codon:yes stop_codon:yes gene_type:complete
VVLEVVELVLQTITLALEEEQQTPEAVVEEETVSHSLVVQVDQEL